MRGVAVAPFEALPVDRGVAAIVGDAYVAVFRLSSGEVAAIDHVDPASGVPVLARGLIGSVADVVYVASPLHKQRFDLRTGRCLDDPDLAVRVWPTDIVDGLVCVGVPCPNSDPREQPTATGATPC
ncbi:MAG: nitrite reductase small subunit NirD [Ilumatobacter sp.]